MTLLQPSYLWGLLALAIPIIIHLWSRKKVRTIKVGSIQFIAPTKSKESNSIQLNEWWLLLLRCLVISTLVVILAEPHITTAPDKEEVAYLFEPALLSTADGLARFEQIPLEGRRLLQEDFPLWETGDVIANKEVVPNYWQLAREMEELAADSIVVFTHAFAKAVKGKRPTVKKNITWIPVETTPDNQQPLMAIAHKDSLEIINVFNSAQELGVSRKRMARSDARLTLAKDSMQVQTDGTMHTIPVIVEAAVTVNIIYDKTYNAERLYLEAALRAIRTFSNRDITITATVRNDTQNTGQVDYQILLYDNATAITEIPTLLYRPGTLANSLIIPGETLNSAILTKKLNIKRVTEEPIVAQLQAWLDLDKEINDQITHIDKRTVALSQLETMGTPATETVQKAVIADMSGILWLVLIGLLVGERILARIRKQ